MPEKRRGLEIMKGEIENRTAYYAKKCKRLISIFKSRLCEDDGERSTKAAPRKLFALLGNVKIQMTATSNSWGPVDIVALAGRRLLI